MLYKNDRESEYFRKCSKYPEIIEFNEDSLLKITNEKFIETLRDKIFLFEIERISI